VALPPRPAIRRLAVVAGYLWLALAFMLLVVSVLAYALIGPPFVIFAIVGVAALAHAAILFTQAPARRLFVGSTLTGLSATVAGLAAIPGRGLIPIELILAFTAVAGLAALATGTAARLSSTVR
jgi:hypothetical protein